MTDDTQASGSERRRSTPNPLHIAPESKKPDLDYQWLAMSVMGKSRADSIDRFMKDGHWAPVPRSDMPDEFSGNDEFIQVQEMRLFCRPMYLTEAARKEDLDAAMAPVNALEGILYGSAPPMRPPPLTRSSYVPRRDEWEPAWKRKNRVEAEAPHGWYAQKRGRILILHQYRVNPRLRPWLTRYWQILLRFRVCYLSYDESELAERQGTTFGTWAWAKRDLLQKGVIPYHRPRFNLTVKTFVVKLPKLPLRQWWTKMRAKIKR